MDSDHGLQHTGESSLDTGQATRPIDNSRHLRRVPATSTAGEVRPVPFGEHDLTRYATCLRRRWRTALAVFVVVVAGVAIGMLTRPPVYRAAGLLEVKPESAGAVSVDALFASERVANDELETQFGILKSTTLAERVVETLARDKGSAESLPRLSLRAFRNGLSVLPQKGSRLVEVAFTTDHPGLAARVVNTVFDTYLQMRREDAQQSVSWLEGQLRIARTRLEASEARLQAFPGAVGIEVLETGRGELVQSINERLRSLAQSHTEAKADRFAKQSAFELTPEPEDRGPDSSVAQSLVIRLGELRREQARLSTMYHAEYPAMQAVSGQIAEVEAALAAETRHVRTQQEQEYRAAVRRERLLRGALHAQNAQAQRFYQDAGGYEALKREVVTNQQLYASLNERLQQMNVSAALRAANVGIVDRPRPPTRPTGSPLGLELGMVVFAGMLAAACAAFIKEYLDTSVRTREDVETYLGVPTLAAIPVLPPPRRRLLGAAPPLGHRRWQNISQDGWQQSALAEGVAALRTAVLLDDDAHTSRTLLVTSAESEEGKTTVSVNLALSLARLRNRVLLIDANMRCPCVEDALGLPPGPGLVDYLTGQEPWPRLVREHAVEQLDILTGGARPTVSPADLLALPRMRALVDEAAAAYDFVILDSPAVLASPADVRSLATLVGSVLVTVRQGTTRRASLSRALSQLPRVSGVILNRAEDGEASVFDLDIRESDRFEGGSPHAT